MNNRTIALTGSQGEILVPMDETYEPEPGSIVLVEGLHGTAWQRFFSDGLWHSVHEGTKPLLWVEVLEKRNLVLVYDADPRPARTEPTLTSVVIV